MTPTTMSAQPMPSSLVESVRSACRGIAEAGDERACAKALEELKLLLRVQPVASEDGEDLVETATFAVGDPLDEADDRGLRCVDLLARGRDSDAACFALLFLHQAGARIDEQPSPSEAPPLHAAASCGNWRFLSTLIALGVDPAEKANGPRQQLLGSTALHAVATGFRASKADDYAECFSALLAGGCDVDALDRKRQRAIDIAMRSAATTGNMTLTEAMLAYGVETRGDHQTSASSVAQALAKRSGDGRMYALLTANEVAQVYRAVQAQQVVQQVVNETSEPAGLRP